MDTLETLNLRMQSMELRMQMLTQQVGMVGMMRPIMPPYLDRTPSPMDQIPSSTLGHSKSYESFDSFHHVEMTSAAAAADNRGQGGNYSCGNAAVSPMERTETPKSSPAKAQAPNPPSYTKAKAHAPSPPSSQTPNPPQPPSGRIDPEYTRPSPPPVPVEVVTQMLAEAEARVKSEMEAQMLAQTIDRSSAAATTNPEGNLPRSGMLSIDSAKKGTVYQLTPNSTNEATNLHQVGQTSESLTLFGTRVVAFGKHKGRTFDAAYTLDQDYCQWILRDSNDNSCTGMQELCRYIQARKASERALPTNTK